MIEAMDITNEIIVWAAAPTVLPPLVAPGSAIVSTRPARNGDVVIDYEGNLYGAAGMDVYANRVFHAWDRQVTNYPTIARRAARVEHLVRIGTFDPKAGKVVVEGLIALQDWLGDDAKKPEQLVCTEHRYVVRRAVLAMIATGDPAKVQNACRWAVAEGVIF